MKEYDIVIVGAGSGGSTAAKEAAEKSFKTIFFEQGRKPGEKNSSWTGHCLECGACHQVCESDAIEIGFPASGTGIVIEQG